jgi:dipeptidyl aminopeptidase/acylaminoacyl peptidase
LPCSLGLGAAAVALLGCAAPRAPYTPAQLGRAVLIEEMVLRPDGRRIAFTTDRSGAFELWTVDIDARGAPTSALRACTSAHEHVTGIAYAPDGSAIVFANDHGGDEKTDLFLFRDGAAAAERLTDTKDVAEQGARFSPDGRALVFSCDVGAPGRFDLCAMDLASKRVERVTHEDASVVAPMFLPDGRGVVGTRTPDDQRGVLLFAGGGSAVRAVPPPRRDGVAYVHAALPGGPLIATALDDAGFMRLATVDPATGATTLFGPGDWDIDHVATTKDGALVVTRNVRGASEVRFGARLLSNEGYADAVDVDAAGNVIAIARETPVQPGSIVVVPKGQSDATVVVAAEMAGVDPALLGPTEVHAFTSFDDRPVDAWITSPAVNRLGSPPPAVVYVHGGPDSEAHPWFDPLVIALSEAGFVVVRVNYRGSVGYGRAFRDLNNHDWGGGDLGDLLAVVRALADAGAIDAARVGITGGSYGGYMTLRAITKEPSMWRAAVERYGMADLEEDYRLSDARFRDWYETEMGDPQHDGELFRDRSPVHALDRVVAPLLVLQGANDTNVPRAESDGLVAALRARGGRVDYVVYPDEGHEFTKRESRIDADRRTVDFFVSAFSPR